MTETYSQSSLLVTTQLKSTGTDNDEDIIWCRRSLLTLPETYMCIRLHVRLNPATSYTYCADSIIRKIY